MTTQHDINNMRAAINMARRGIGRTAENPSVGCVIVKDGTVIARSRTADGGRPHAEPQAIDRAGDKAIGATLYVTLEPCANHGKTPPCVDAVIKSGVKRVVIGMTDPNPETNGASVQRLKNAGLEAVTDILKSECEDIHRGFISRITRARPYVTLKCAATIDGKIACASGESKWITGINARRHVHALRSKHDAIMVGIHTALHDDPMLNARLDGLNHTITRIVMDRELRINPDSRLVQSANQFPLLVLHENGNPDSLIKAGAQTIKTDCGNIPAVLKLLAQQGINNLMIEGGAKLQSSFLKAGCFDEILLYRAPTLLGEPAKSVVSDLNIDTLAKRLDLHRIAYRSLGEDTLEIYKNKE